MIPAPFCGATSAPSAPPARHRPTPTQANADRPLQTLPKTKECPTTESTLSPANFRLGTLDHVAAGKVRREPGKSRDFAETRRKLGSDGLGFDWHVGFEPTLYGSTRWRSNRHYLRRKVPAPIRLMHVFPHFLEYVVSVQLERSRICAPLARPAETWESAVDWDAGGPGFEPGLTGSEPRVLPLNYPPIQAGRWI
jgi:hypothetical protein